MVLSARTAGNTPANGKKSKTRIFHDFFPYRFDRYRQKASKEKPDAVPYR